jgi:cell division protein FtsL
MKKKIYGRISKHFLFTLIAAAIVFAVKQALLPSRVFQTVSKPNVVEFKTTCEPQIAPLQIAKKVTKIVEPTTITAIQSEVHEATNTYFFKKRLKVERINDALAYNGSILRLRAL